MNKIYITEKKARAMFIKFLMTNNCYREFIVCYKGQFNRDKYSTIQVFDSVINESKNNGGRFCLMLYVSFGWSNSADDLGKIRPSMADAASAAYYWTTLSNKLEKEYPNYFINNNNRYYGKEVY